MLYTLKLYSDVCQLYLNKTGKKYQIAQNIALKHLRQKKLNPSTKTDLLSSLSGKRYAVG